MATACRHARTCKMDLAAGPAHACRTASCCSARKSNCRRRRRGPIGWISADSRYQLTVNGQRVQWGPAPCDPRNLDADPIDLKPYLKAGKNVIGVEVLFYGHGDGTWPGGKPGLILNLDVETPGVQQQVVTDKSWQALLDRAHRPGHYKRWFLRSLQEEFDARLYPYGWDTADFRPDARWVAALEIALPAGQGPGVPRGRHWSADSVDRTAPEVSSLRMRQIPPTRETLIAGQGPGALRPRALEARSGRLVRCAHARLVRGRHGTRSP